MTTRDFIERTYNVPSTKDRRCSSVFTDHKGTVYSYGYHFPLAFNVMGLDFINTASYSSSTNKHQSWAKSALGYNNYLPVVLWTDEARVIGLSYSTDEEKIKAIRKAIVREVNRVYTEVAKKKRKDTQVYAWLEHQLKTATDALRKVDEVLA